MFRRIGKLLSNWSGPSKENSKPDPVLSDLKDISESAERITISLNEMTAQIKECSQEIKEALGRSQKLVPNERNPAVRTVRNFWGQYIKPRSLD